MDLKPCPFCGKTEVFLGEPINPDEYGVLQKGLQDNVNDLERRLINLTDAIDDFLNDARERPAVDKIERAMNDYGMRE